MPLSVRHPTEHRCTQAIWRITLPYRSKFWQEQRRLCRILPALDSRRIRKTECLGRQAIWNAHSMAELLLYIKRKCKIGSYKTNSNGKYRKRKEKSMKVKKILALLLTAIVTVSSISGCGGGNSSDNSSGGGVNPVPMHRQKYRIQELPQESILTKNLMRLIFSIW